MTGGGAHNSFLLERIRAYTKATLHVPDKLTVDYKEALVFALLGVLRMRGEVNTLKSVTGAKRDSVGGRCIWLEEKQYGSLHHHPFIAHPTGVRTPHHIRPAPKRDPPPPWSCREPAGLVKQLAQGIVHAVIALGHQGVLECNG
ncbi:MAG: anhydro-N-acetylmuramic acid kinase [Flavobacteriales bacterium]|nr:anhydro-N-acetylmuramic acid kinase [Flavobacteriales bacterium]